MVHFRTSNPWKKWGLAGFICFGAAFALTAYFADLTFLDDLNLYLKIAAGGGAAIVGCAFSSCIATIKYYRQRVVIQNQDLMKVLINTDTDDNPNQVISSHYIMEQALCKPESHAAFCANLVREFNDHLALGSVDVDEYINEAKNLKKEFLKRHPGSQGKYFQILQTHGYLFNKEPEEIFAQNITAAVKQSRVIQISPPISPPESPTTRLYNSVPKDHTELNITTKIKC